MAAADASRSKEARPRRSSTIPDADDIPLRQYRSHSRHWRDNLYVYPVISRRSHGLSVGVNLNPDMACNFDCVYCQVDRSVAPRTRDVDPEQLRQELTDLLASAVTGTIFADEAFSDVPADWRSVRDIAFSGDGEPTTCKQFRQCVEIAAAAKREAGLSETKIVLITDACYLTRPEVVAALPILDENQGEIWAKLDAGTEAYYREVNRPNYPLAHVIENISAVARLRPVVIQSLFMRLSDQGPSDAELAAYVDRLRTITDTGGRISLVQVYTVARRPAQDFVTPLSNHEIDRIVELVRRQTGLAAEAFYGAV